MLKHEAICVGEELRPSGENDDEREGSHQHDAPVRHAARGHRRMVMGDGFDIVPTVEANGNKPISPLSVAAEPHCVSIKELQLGRREFNSPA